MLCRELLRLLPRVLRARDFHLYLENGTRLTDLWLAGGRAVLGHKPPQVLRELKNAAERGLFSPLPHPLERRFIKALEVFFPGRAFRLYMDEGSLRRALDEAGKPDVSLWRPFQKTATGTCLNFTTNDTNSYLRYAHELFEAVLMPVLPFSLGPSVLVMEKSMEASFPPGELIPPVLLAPAARALYNLAAEMKAPPPNRGCPRFHKIEKALENSNCIWEREGIYLSLKQDMNNEEHRALFVRFLEGGFLIPPSPGEPLILPGIMSKGEETKLAQLLATASPTSNKANF
jgi:hypothetical protein